MSCLIVYNCAPLFETVTNVGGSERRNENKKRT